MTSGDWNVSHQSTLLLARQAIGMEVLRAECCAASSTPDNVRKTISSRSRASLNWPFFIGLVARGGHCRGMANRQSR